MPPATVLARLVNTEGTADKVTPVPPLLSGSVPCVPTVTLLSPLKLAATVEFKLAIILLAVASLVAAAAVPVVLRAPMVFLTAAASVSSRIVLAKADSVVVA